MEKCRKQMNYETKYDEEYEEIEWLNEKYFINAFCYPL